MPYRRAHWWVLLLFPMIGVAFWQSYLSDPVAAPFSLHAHGITAALWLALVAAQGWSMQARHNALHRSTGLAVFAVVPLFVAGGILAMQDMGILFQTAADPFHAAFGARLGLVDAVSIATLLLLVRAALAQRSRVRLHAGYILATVFLVLPPILARLPTLLGPPPEDLGGFHPFEISFEAGQIVAVTLALIAAYRSRPHGKPFAMVAAIIAYQSLLFETLGRTPWWQANYVTFSELPRLPMAAGAIVLAFVILWHGWKQPRTLLRAPATA